MNNPNEPSVPEHPPLTGFRYGPARFVAFTASRYSADDLFKRLSDHTKAQAGGTRGPSADIVILDDVEVVPHGIWPTRASLQPSRRFELDSGTIDLGLQPWQKALGDQMLDAAERGEPFILHPPRRYEITLQVEEFSAELWRLMTGATLIRAKSKAWRSTARRQRKRSR